LLGNNVAAKTRIQWRGILRDSCLAILLPVLAGYALACLAHFPVKWFYNSICEESGLDNEEGFKPKVPHIVIGTFERVIAFFLAW